LNLYRSFVPVVKEITPAAGLRPPENGEVGHFPRLVPQNILESTRHREALVRAEHALNARNYDKFYQAIEQAKLPDRTIRQLGATDLPLFSFHRLLGTEFKNNKTYLVETLVPAGGAIMSYGLPKGLKSWFSTAVALDAAIGRCKALNYFDVPRPVCVLLVQVEDPADRTRDRLQRLHASRLFRRNPDPINFKIITRCPLNLSDPDWIARLERIVAKHKTELIIFDVFRRLFRGNVNSPEDTAAFFETVDKLRDRYGLAVWIVHHSNKNADTAMITKALASINITGWPDVVLYFKGKQQSGGVTTCNLEIETKDEPIEGELKVILDDENEPMLRVEKAKSAEGKLQKATSQLNGKWTVDDLAHVLGLTYAGAYKVLQDWRREGIAVLVKKGSKGHRARYKFRQIAAE
jgi:hypothetical protein